MFRIKFSLVFLTITLFLSSCNLVKSIPQPLPSPSSNWIVKLNQSGGIAGVQLNIEISSDGQLRAEDQRSNRIVTQTLPPQTLTKIHQLMGTTSVSMTGVPQSGCADCFIYDLEIQTEESNYHINVDDVTMKNSSAAELITLLSKLRDGALAANP